MEPRKRIGNLLVEAGIISVKTLERALELQKGSGKRLGALLRGMGIVTEEEVVEALARQCNLKIVKNFAGLAFPRELLDLVPDQMALEKIIFPLKHNENSLAIATLDPFDRETFTRLAEKTGRQIYLALATKKDIIAAVEKYYLKEARVKSGRQRVLLIDRSSVFTQVLCAALEKEGFEVLVAGDGIEGLKLAIFYHPDLILCDLSMPRMDGYTFLHAVKADHDLAHIPVMLMTVRASVEEEHRALQAGFMDFIGKPVMPVRVLALIKRTLLIAGNKTRGKMKEPGTSDFAQETGRKAA